MKTITIVNVRQIENDYAAISNIAALISDFRYEANTITDNENDMLIRVSFLIDKLQERLFTEAKKTAIKYLKTA